VLENVVSRFEERFDKLTSIVEQNLSALNTTQIRALKRFTRMNISMEAMVKLLGNATGGKLVDPQSFKNSDMSEMDVDKPPIE
jgi:hypothetical protein